MNIYIIEKARNSIAKKTVSQFTIKPLNKKIKNGQEHTSMDEMCCALFKHKNKR